MIRTDVDKILKKNVRDMLTMEENDYCDILILCTRAPFFSNGIDYAWWCLTLSHKTKQAYATLVKHIKAFNNIESFCQNPCLIFG